jgi:hypothetical protein
MTNQESIQYPAVLDKKRVENMLTVEIKTSPEKIFPLACPVEELRWIRDWEYQLIYTKSGVNENNCMFIENVSGPIFFGRQVATTWITTFHDPDKYRVHFLLIMEEKAVIKFEFQCREIGINTSVATWHFVYTALDSEADKLTEQAIKENLMTIISFISSSLKHYCETGKIL